MKDVERVLLNSLFVHFKLIKYLCKKAKMATITIQFDDKTKLDKILNFIKRLKVPFHILDLQSDLEIQWGDNANEMKSWL